MKLPPIKPSCSISLRPPPKPRPRKRLVAPEIEKQRRIHSKVLRILGVWIAYQEKPEHRKLPSGAGLRTPRDVFILLAALEVTPEPLPREALAERLLAHGIDVDMTLLANQLTRLHRSGLIHQGKDPRQNFAGTYQSSYTTLTETGYKLARALAGDFKLRRGKWTDYHARKSQK